MANFTPRTARYQSYIRLGGHQKLSGTLGKNKHFFFRIEYRILDRPARNRITTPTTISRSLLLNAILINQTDISKHLDIASRKSTIMVIRRQCWRKAAFMKPSSFRDTTQCSPFKMHKTVGQKVAVHYSGCCLQLLYGRTGPSFQKPKQKDGKHKRGRPWTTMNCSSYCLLSLISLMLERGRTQQFNNKVHFLTLNFKKKCNLPLRRSTR